MLDRWRDDDIVAAARTLRAGNEPWTFYEGPPTANGRPGLHHVWARVFKDIYPRFQTMRGRQVPRKGGWDCHGLPVELEVEKELGLSTKHEIEAFGIAEFNRRCRESVHRYVADWEALTDRAGVWIDTADAYWTLDNTYVESVWWLVRQLWDDGPALRGPQGVARTAAAAAPPCRATSWASPTSTATSSTRRSTCASRSTGRDVDLLVWTTTPWTLISNVAAAVGPDIDYVRVAADRRRPRPGHGRAARAPEDAEVVERFTGADLVGWRYQRPFTFLDPPPGADGWRVVAADFVTTDDGSGIVHLAPAFGEDDAVVGRAEGLPVLNPVDADAAFDASVAALHRAVRQGRRPRHHRRPRPAGPARCASRPTSTATPTAGGAARRSSTGPRPRGSSAPPSAATSSSGRTRRIGWHPEFIKHGRFGKWLEGNVDWALSRDRYWGTPLPIWRCDEAGHEHCIGSVAELSELAGRDLTELDLHRPYVDDVTFACTDEGCAATMTRVAPVLDAWFDSGLHAVGPAPLPVRRRRPRAHHPGRLPRRLHLRGHRPDPRLVLLTAGRQLARVRLDAVPQRGLPGPHRRRERPEDVEVEGQRDRPLRHLRHASAPTPCAGTSSPSGQPWTPRRVFPDGIREATRQTLLTLWNVHSFFTTYADLDGWEPAAEHGRRPPTCSTAGCCPSSTTPSPPSPRRSRASTPSAAPPGSPASSTTSRTGTCGAAGRGSGRRATPRPTPPSTSAWSPWPSSWPPSARSWPTRSTPRSPAPGRCTSPTGPRPRAATTRPWPSR